MGILTHLGNRCTKISCGFIVVDLYMRGLVYHGEVPTQARPQAEPRDTHQAAALRAVVREFHQFVHAGAADQAWAAVYQRTQDPEMRSMFCSEVQGLAGNKLSSWTIKDLIIYNMQGESASFPNASIRREIYLSRSY